MAVEKNIERKAVEIKWDTGDYDGDVVIELTGGLGDVHNTVEMPNDGYAPVSYPADFTGTSSVRVLDLEGNVLDEGEISV